MTSQRPSYARVIQSCMRGIAQGSAESVAGKREGVVGHLCSSLIPIPLYALLNAILRHNWLDRLPVVEHQALTVWIWSTETERELVIRLTYLTRDLEDTARKLGRVIAQEISRRRRMGLPL